jgi:beta-glucuronidase
MSRQIIALNRRWRFTLDRENTGIKDGWHKKGIPVYREVMIPHTYSIEPGSETYHGPVWYEYCFEGDFTGKRLRLQCNGIYRDADFWLNGEYAGRHYGSGFTAFTLDITNLPRAAANILTIRVQKPYTFDALPQGRHFDWADDGGIIRDVALIVTGMDAIDYVQIFAGPKIDNTASGERIFTADADFSALVNFCPVPAAQSGASRSLSYRIFRDGDETPVFSSAELPVKNERQIRLPAVVLNNIGLWHFDRPQLYKLHVTVSAGNTMSDEMTINFGFRKFIAQGTRFVLNGEKVRLTGIEWMPGSNPAYGNAEPQNYLFRILNQLKECNCVFTRFHWQQDDAVYDWCDRNGILVQEEIPSWGKPVPPEAAEMPLYCSQADEMIASHCNHPSIVSWGMANELKGQAPETSRFMRELKQYFNKIDPTRLVSYVSHTVWPNPAIDAVNVGDMMMVNDYWGTWNGPGDTGALLRRVVSENPGKPLVISETGLCEPANAGGDKRRIELFIEKMSVYRSIPELTGVIQFCLNDYRTQMGEEGDGALKRRVHGSTDIFGEPKPSYYVVQKYCSPLRITNSSPNGKYFEMLCADDVPSYTVEGYYLEYLNAEHGLIRRENIPLLKPGASARFEYEDPKTAYIRVQRPNGHLVLEWKLADLV